MNPKLQAILAKYQVQLFEFRQTGDLSYQLNTDEPITTSCHAELLREMGMFELTLGSLPKPLQPMLPGMPPSMVAHPPHYNAGKFEVIEVIEDWKLGYHRGNAVKYIARAGLKDPTKEVEDLEKAVWYLKRYMELLKAAKEGREVTRPNAMNPKKSGSISVTDACASTERVVRTGIAPDVLGKLIELKGQWEFVRIEQSDDVLAFFPTKPVAICPEMETSVWAVPDEK